jgi:glucosyl-3-phosphoglycerate phosphatase
LVRCGTVDHTGSADRTGSADHVGALERLGNRYFVMRHGQSKANVAGIIVSRIETDASGDYGLSEAGREQVLAAARTCGLPAGTLVCSSDFTRAAQTAKIMAAHLGSPEVVFAAALRERCFGAWEGTSTENYPTVWAADEEAAGEKDGEAAGEKGEEVADGEAAGEKGVAANGVEPARAVLDRAIAFLLELERRHQDLDILLVSHGDTLQILQAGLCRMDPSRHRHLPHLETAEVRRLSLAARA